MRPPPPPQWTLPHEGVVIGTGPNGGALVEVDGFGVIEATISRPDLLITVQPDSQPDTHQLAATLPDGARCLVLFAAGRTAGAWIVGVAP